ncbi:MAG: 4-hydroxythreonine-4-phosphate dehydrogenase PdxA [Rhodospirillales bacterium]|nr:4-hydroxythreonine-4-phosphate dehydrogenase PdxA [Rhodospirillales bacterium]
MTPCTPRRKETAAPLALTMGEPAGIGGELTLKAWLRRDQTPTFFVIDDPDRLRRLARTLGLPVEIAVIDTPQQTSATFEAALPVLARRLAVASVPGAPNLENAPAVRASIEDAVASAMSGQAAAVVTNPVHKETLYRSGFPFPGHTEFLADLGGMATPPVMMLVATGLRTVPVTVHVSLADAIKTLSTERIVAAATIAHAALRTDFGFAKPRLAVAGLNPHAGEGGALGNEETEVIVPAIAALRANGIEAFGPRPADALFSARARKDYDAAICMYHDQALIPVKTLDFDGAVNVTLGLPFVRTSPDHGTALDIAGTGNAHVSSLLAALGVAADMARRRSRAGA